MSFSNIRSFDVPGDEELSKILQANESDLFQLNSQDLKNQLDPALLAYLVKEEPILPVNVAPQRNELVISNEDYAGPFDFNIEIDPHHGNKSPWVYSAPLNKVFILMNQKFPIDFRVTGAENKVLYVRATPVYTTAQDFQEIVSRCIPHALENDKSNIGFSNDVLQHIIRCHYNQVWYLGHKDDKKHLSVVVPIGRPQTGSTAVRHIYEFVCKNSCVTGMNRRPIEVIFTLEDESAQIFGRRVLCVRICSCPKRDKDKEEVEFSRRGNKSDPPQGKKRRLEKKPNTCCQHNEDTKIYDLNLKIPGKKNAKSFYEAAYNIMAGCIQKTGNQEPYQTCLKEIQQKINTLGEDL